VVGAIVGVGIFFNPARMAGLTGSGPLLLLAWGIAGVIAICGALAFAELGGLYNRSGAQYEVLRDAYGPMPAFLFVFCNATAIQAGSIGIIAVICAQNLGVAAGLAPPTGVALLTTAAVLIALLMAANIVGVRWGARIQNFTVYAKVLTLIAVTILAAAMGSADVSSVMAPPEVGEPARLSAAAGVLAALVPALFAFGGWQHALWISGEVKNPRKNLPVAIIGGVLIVIVVYLLANWGYLRLLGIEGVAASTSLAADAVAAGMPKNPEFGRRLIGAAVGVSAFGVLNAQLLSGPRLILGMAQDGRFFKVFGGLSGRFGTPVAAIVLLGGMALALLFAAGDKGFDRLLAWVVFIDAAFFALTGMALIVLRRKRPDADGATRPFRVPLYPVVPLLFIVGEVGAVVGTCLDPAVRSAALFGVAWICAGSGLYLIRFRKAGG